MLQKVFTMQKKDSKEIWNALRQVVPGKVKNTNITCIKTDVDEYTELKSIANALNEHFATVGPKLAAKIPGKSKNDRMAAPECNDKNDNIDQCKFHLEPVSEEYILKQLKTLSENKTCNRYR